MIHLENGSRQDDYLSLFELTGADPMRGVAVAELARHMLTIRTVWRYQRLMQEIANLISPVREVSREELRVVIDSLEVDGDLIIEGGAIHATQIRAIRLDDWTFKFMTSLNTRTLARLFPGDWTCRESMRICHPIEPRKVAKQIAANGGVLLTPEGWVALDQQPVADEQWLAGIEKRLADHPHPPESERYGHKMSWEWLSFDHSRLAWRKSLPPHGTHWMRIWRGINLREYWIYGLTSYGSPVDRPWLQLGRDDANRTIFALARTAGLNIPFSVSQDRDLVALTIPPILPYAEFRYLTVVSRSRHSAPHAVRWKFCHTLAPRILEILERRLGLSTGNLTMESQFP